MKLKKRQIKIKDDYKIKLNYNRLNEDEKEMYSNLYNALLEFGRFTDQQELFSTDNVFLYLLQMEMQNWYQWFSDNKVRWVDCWYYNQRAIMDKECNLWTGEVRYKATKQPIKTHKHGDYLAHTMKKNGLNSKGKKTTQDVYIHRLIWTSAFMYMNTHTKSKERAAQARALLRIVQTNTTKNQLHHIKGHGDHRYFNALPNLQLIRQSEHSKITQMNTAIRKRWELYQTALQLKDAYNPFLLDDGHVQVLDFLTMPDWERLEKKQALQAKVQQANKIIMTKTLNSIDKLLPMLKTS